MYDSDPEYYKHLSLGVVNEELDKMEQELKQRPKDNSPKDTRKYAVPF